MVVLYATPFFTPGSLGLITALSQLEGVRLALVSQAPQDALPLRLQRLGHWQVQDALQADQLEWACRQLARRFGRISHVLSASEQIQLPLAQVRDRLGLGGLSAQQVLNFRDKGRMKDLFGQHDIPCARHCRADQEDQVWAFVQEVGFPICVKPVDGAAAQATYRVENSRALRDLLKSRPLGASAPLQCEEFLLGQEHSLESFTLKGQTLWHSWTRYEPTPLEVMRNPWIQWRIVLPREVDQPQDILQLGPRALQALGMDTGLSHLEWFRRPDGRLAIGEVGARPPGAQITTMMDRAHDFDSQATWARLMVFGEFQTPPPRRFAVGNAFLRGLGSGRVRAVHGLERVQQELGSAICDFSIPQPGQAAALTYEGEGFIMVRHPETGPVEEMLQFIIDNVRVELA